MKNLIITIFLCIIGTSLSKSQENFLPKAKGNFNSRLYLVNRPNPIDGILYEVCDSSLIFAGTYSHKTLESGACELYEVEINQVQRIKIYKSGNTLSGTIIGCLTGFIIGVIVKPAEKKEGWFLFIPYEHYDRTNQFRTGLMLAAAGGVVGGLIGTGINIKIPIDGDANIFNKNKNQLRRYSYK